MSFLYLLFLQYDTQFVGRVFKSNTFLCLSLVVSNNYIEVENITWIIVTLFLGILIILIIILIIVLIYYCIKKWKPKNKIRVAPALIAAVMGKRVSYYFERKV